MNLSTNSASATPLVLVRSLVSSLLWHHVVFLMTDRYYSCRCAANDSPNCDSGITTLHNTRAATVCTIPACICASGDDPTKSTSPPERGLLFAPAYCDAASGIVLALELRKQPHRALD